MKGIALFQTLPSQETIFENFDLPPKTCSDIGLNTKRALWLVLLSGKCLAAPECSFIGN